MDAFHHADVVEGSRRNGRHADADTDSNPESHADTDSNADSNTHANANADSDSDAHADTVGLRVL